VLDDPFLQKHAVSQLAMLSESSYAAGIDMIKADLEKAKAGSQTFIFKSQLRLDILTGNIPKDK